MSNKQINKATYEAAIEFTKQLRAMDIHWDEMANIAKMVEKIEVALASSQETNLLDVEDVLQEIIINVNLYNMRRDFGQAVYWVIDRNGKKEEDSPNFITVTGHMNDDDLQSGGDEDLLKVENDLSSISAPDAGPGSDLHIAAIDIEDRLGEKYRNFFEAKMAGEPVSDIMNDLGYTRKEARWCENRIEELLKRGQYTLDSTNRRLGTARRFDSGKSFFPAERRTKRTWSLPEANHRSISFVDPVEYDNTPIAPCGDEIKPSVLVFDDGTPAVDLRRDVPLLDAELTEDTVRVVSWDVYPNGHSGNAGTTSKFGDPATWKPYADTAYGISLYNTIPGVKKLPVPIDEDMIKCERWEAAERRRKEKLERLEN